MILVDTSELMRPTQRKLHAAWQELQGRQVLATPGVARELAPLAVDVAWMGRPSDAENRLRAGGSRLPKRRGNELRQQAWWGEMWADGKSPYGIVTLTPEQEELAERIRTVIDPACFPNTDPEDIPGLGDAAIVSESMALGAKLLLTSDLRSIDHIEVNRWTVENGTEWGIPAEETLHDADLTFLDWTKTPAELERWIQAGLLACWPSANNAPAGAVLDSTEEGIGRMTRGDGGKLRHAGQRGATGCGSTPTRTAWSSGPDGGCRVLRSRATAGIRRTRTDRAGPTPANADREAADCTAEKAGNQLQPGAPARCTARRGRPGDGDDGGVGRALEGGS